MRWASRVGQKLHPLAEPRSARDQPMVQAECRERAYSSYAEATPIDAERKREPEGQPRRARGDDEASVARSAARGAYRHHHSTQHCAKRAAIHRFLFICVNLCANLSLANHAARRQTAGQSPKPPKGGCTNLVQAERKSCASERSHACMDCRAQPRLSK